MHGSRDITIVRVPRQGHTARYFWSMRRSKRPRTGSDEGAAEPGSSAKQTVLRTFFTSLPQPVEECVVVEDAVQPPCLSSLAWVSRHYETPSVFAGDTRHPSAGGGALDAVRRKPQVPPPVGVVVPPARAAAGPDGWQARNLRLVLQAAVCTSLRNAVDGDCVAVADAVLSLAPTAQALLAALFYAPDVGSWHRLVPGRHVAASAPSLPLANGDGDCEEERNACLTALLQLQAIDLAAPPDAVAALLSVGEADNLVRRAGVARCGGESRTALVAALTRTQRVTPTKAALITQLASIAGPVARLTAPVALALAQLHRLVFVCSGCSPEDTVSLLSQDMAALGTAKIATSIAPARLCPASAAQAATHMHAAAALLDAVHAAATSGDLNAACRAMHDASCLLMDEAAPGDDASRVCDITWALRRARRSIACRALLRGVALLERARRYEDASHYALVLLTSPSALACDACHLALGEAALRRCLDLEHTGAKDESLACAERILVAKHNGQQAWPQGAALVALSRFVARMAVPPRRWKTPVGLPVILDAPEVKLTLRRDPSTAEWLIPDASNGTTNHLAIRSVEAAVLAHYAAHGGWAGSHTENSPWAALFSLLFDTVILGGDGDGNAPPPGTWLCPLADTPLDFGAGIAHRRPLATAARCASLRAMSPAQLAEDVTATQQRLRGENEALGVQHRRGGGWPCSLPAEMLPHLAAAVGGPLCASLCEAYAHSYDTCMCGYPDLILWRRKQQAGGAAGGSYDFRLVEVKGPGDKLSDRQRWSLSLLTKGGADVSVCYVAASAA